MTAGEGEVSRLVEQLRASFEGESWHGPAVLDVLQGVSADAAARHPVPGAHSIWQLALHLGSTYRLVLRRLSGDARQLTPEEDWPAVPPVSDAAWSETVRGLHELNRELRRAVQAFPAGRLGEPLLPESPHSAFTQFIGVTQHDLYHAGQIAVLKRALERG